MSYAERARRYLSERQSEFPTTAVLYERNERNELSRSNARTGGIGPNTPAPFTPPAGCIASRIACPVLGPCPRHLAGNPCLVADVDQEAAR